MSALAFTAPVLLLALVVLPILWWLLRAVPPAPIRRRFPGIVLLLGLRDEESQTATTPWWLLLLRMLALAAVIIGFAGPILNPRQAGTGTGPLLVVMDASWASARDWPARMAKVEQMLRDAARAGRTAAVLSLTEPLPEEIPWQSADAWVERLPSIVPNAWEPEYSGLAGLDVDGAEVVWVSDGLDRPGRDAVTARVIESARPVLGLVPAAYDDGVISLRALRLGDGTERGVDIRAVGPGPNGAMTQLGIATADFAAGATEAEVSLTLPPELRNRVARFEIVGERSAGAVSLTDDSLARREVALLTRAEDEAQDLLSPLYYLRRALDPTADLIEGDLETLLPAAPDVLVLADVARLSPGETAQVTEWVEDGGLLLRFAGPVLAASDISRNVEDPLMPVRLRSGGRTVGGALSWGEPKALRPFDPTSPFFGLDVPDDVEVTSQIVAQPDPTLAERTIAALADGTPLVTRKTLGQGQVVLFHVTANAEWSTLPLSGLFVRMLERLAVSTRPAGDVGGGAGGHDLGAAGHARRVRRVARRGRDGRRAGRGSGRSGALRRPAARSLRGAGAEPRAQRPRDRCDARRRPMARGDFHRRAGQGRGDRPDALPAGSRADPADARRDRLALARRTPAAGGRGRDRPAGSARGTRRPCAGGAAARRGLARLRSHRRRPARRGLGGRAARPVRRCWRSAPASSRTRRAASIWRPTNWPSSRCSTGRWTQASPPPPRRPTAG